LEEQDNGFTLKVFVVQLPAGESEQAKANHHRAIGQSLVRIPSDFDPTSLGIIGECAERRGGERRPGPAPNGLIRQTQ
jgi:hypothetical protein